MVKPGRAGRIASGTLAAAFFIWAPMAVPVSPAYAAFAPGDLVCRESIAARGIALAKASANALVACHALRLEGGLPSDFDCRFTEQADYKGRLARQKERLRTGIVKKCGARPPVELGYSTCPFPCDAFVPAIGTYSNVADCLACVLTRDIEVMTGGALGNPAVPIGDIEARCHDTLGSHQTKHFLSVLKEKRKCQKAAEKRGTMDASTCAGAPLSAKTARSRSAAAAAIDAACAGATLAALDACAEITVPALESCVLGASSTIGREAFRSLYGLDAGAGSTTTTFGGTVTTTTVSTTTTTTLDTSFDFVCGLTMRVTSNELLGSLKYVIDYGSISGGFLGSGLGVSCTNLVAGASKSFFDDETTRVMRESIISINGFTNPRDIAQCSFETDDAGLAPGDFALTVTDATTPDLVPVSPTVVISATICSPQ